MDHTNHVPKKEWMAYCVGALGQGMVYAIMSSYISDFYISVLKLTPLFVLLLMLLARVWDAINDPMMGTFVDRTNTKWGKCRPYLLFSPAVILVITILTFCNGMYSSANTPGKNALIVGWAAVSYILWGMCYTVGDIPLWGVTSRMTEVEKDRASILSLARIAAGLGGGVVLLALYLAAVRAGTVALDASAVVLIVVVGCFCVYTAASLGRLMKNKPEEKAAKKKKKAKKE